MIADEYGNIVKLIKDQPFFDAQTKLTSQMMSSQIGRGMIFSIEKQQLSIHFLLMTKSRSFRKQAKYEITNLNTLASQRDDEIGDIHKGIICFIGMALHEAKFHQKTALERYENWLNYTIDTPMKSPLKSAIDDAGMAIITEVLAYKINELQDSNASVGLLLKQSTYHNRYSDLIVRPTYRRGFEVTTFKKQAIFSISRNFNSDLDVQDEFVITDDTEGIFQVCKGEEILPTLSDLIYVFVEQVKNKATRTKTVNDAIQASQAIRNLLNERPNSTAFAVVIEKQLVYNYIKALVGNELFSQTHGHLNSSRLTFVNVETETPVASFTLEKFPDQFLIRESYTNQTFNLNEINLQAPDGSNLSKLDRFVTDIIKNCQKNTDLETTVADTIDRIIDGESSAETGTNVAITTGMAELFRRALYLKRHDLRLSDIVIDNNFLLIECANGARFDVKISLISGSQRPLSVMVLTSSDELIRKSRLNSFDGLIRLMKDVVSEAIDIQNTENALNDTLTARGNKITIGALMGNKNQTVTMSLPEVLAFMKKEKLTLEAILINTTDDIVKKAIIYQKKQPLI